MVPQVRSEIDCSFHRHEHGYPSGYYFDAFGFGHTGRYERKIRASQAVIVKRKLYDSFKVLDGEKAWRLLFQDTSGYGYMIEKVKSDPPVHFRRRFSPEACSARVGGKRLKDTFPRALEMNLPSNLL